MNKRSITTDRITADPIPTDRFRHRPGPADGKPRASSPAHETSALWEAIQALSTAIMLMIPGSCFTGYLSAQDLQPSRLSEPRGEARAEANVWRFWGGNLHNTHSSAFERHLRPGNVA